MRQIQGNSVCVYRRNSPKQSETNLWILENKRRNYLCNIVVLLILAIEVSVSNVQLAILRRIQVTTKMAVVKRAQATADSASPVQMLRRNVLAVAFSQLASAGTRMSSCARRSVRWLTRSKVSLRSR